MTAEGPASDADASGPRRRLDRVRRDGRTALERARTRTRDHRIALGAALIGGLALAWLHWFGLVLGGALVGLVAPTLRRALVAGLGFGVLVLAAFAITLGGAVGDVMGMTPVVYLAVGTALALPVLGSLARGLV